jgi:hypothetical protein
MKLPTRTRAPYVSANPRPRIGEPRLKLAAFGVLAAELVGAEPNPVYTPVSVAATPSLADAVAVLDMVVEVVMLYLFGFCAPQGCAVRQFDTQASL